MLDDHSSVAVTFTKFQFHLLYMHVLFQSVHSCASMRAKILVEMKSDITKASENNCFLLMKFYVVLPVINLIVIDIFSC